MEIKERVSKRLRWALFGFLFGALLAALGIASSGGGHSNITLMLAVAPYGVGLLLWPILGITVADLGSLWSRRVFVMAMVTHYCGFVIYIFQNSEGEFHWLAIAIRYQSFVTLSLLAIALYILGQSFLWFSFLERNRNRNN